MGLRVMLTLMLVSGLVSAPSWYSQPGTMRAISAFSDGKGYLGLNLFHANMLFLSDDYDTTSKNLVDVYTGLAIGLSRKLTLSAVIPYLYDKYGDSTITSFGDLEVGCKLTVKEGEKAAFGVFPFISIATGSLDKGFKNELRRTHSTGTLDYGLLGLFSFKPSDKVTMNFNVGGFNRYQDDKHNAVTDIALANFSTCFNFGRVNPFIEVSYVNFASRIIWDVRKELYGGNPLRIGGGVNFSFGGFNVDVGGSYYLTKRRVDGSLPDSVYYMLPGEDIDYEISVGISYEKKPTAPTVGLIAGVVKDAKTGKPVKGAQVKLVEIGLVSTTDEAGAFSIADIPAGVYSVEISAPGYETLKAHAMVKAGRKAKVEYALNPSKPAVKKGIIKGKVIDKKTGKGVIAEIYLSEAKKMLTEKDGSFTLKLDPGIHSFKVKAKGYKEANVTMKVKSGKTQSITVSLEPVPPPIKFPMIHFDCCSWRIKPQYAKMLDDLADALKKCPDVKFVIEGHASSDGPEDYNMRLSIKRAESVKKYLVRKGISADRMKVEGYGETRPIAPNDTLEGRRMNRRVQFRLLD